MSPILGIYASQITGHLVPPNSYASIATQTVGSGGASSITFSSIPSTYTHLEFRYLLKPSTGGYQYLNATLNGDSGANYSYHFLVGEGTSPAAAGVGTSASLFRFGATDSTNFGVGVISIFDYSNTNKYKTIRELFGYDSNGTGAIYLTSGAYYSTSAINSITVVPSSGSFVQYSQIALYGVK
jgi:hypothetical protein